MAHRQNSQSYNPFTGNRYGSPPQQEEQYRNEFSEGYSGYDNARYNDTHNEGPYDPYSGYNAHNNYQPRQTYDQGGYTGIAGYRYDAGRNTPSPEGEPPVPPSKEISATTTAYEHDDQVAQVIPRGKLAGP